MNPSNLRPGSIVFATLKHKYTYAAYSTSRAPYHSAVGPVPELSNTAQHPRTPTTQTAYKAPLSPLPASDLLRSLFVATISSNRFLLIPALNCLSFLSRQKTSSILNVERNPILHGLLRRGFYDQFCAGETEAQARLCVQHMKDLGFRGMIMTYAKETVFDHSRKESHTTRFTASSTVNGIQHNEDIEIWRKGTLRTANLIGENDILAVKLTGAGPTVTSAFSSGQPIPKQMQDALEEIATLCKSRNTQIIVDAESQHFQSGINAVTLDLMRKFNTSGRATIYNTYQAYLKSTPANIAKHLAEASRHRFTLGLKVVRGAYILSDNRSLICDTKADTDRQYNDIARGALQKQLFGFGEGTQPFPSVNLFLASHNRESVITAHRLHQQRIAQGLPTVPLAFGQLHGMSDEVSFSLLAEKEDGQDGPQVYKCSTWGSMSECLAYLLRRAVENRDAVGRTNDELRALRGEAWRRMKKVFSRQT